MGLKWHHYGKRMYDAVIARFTGVDPISENFTDLSTFNYASNNPIANIDLHGLQGLYYTETLQSGQDRHVIEKNVIVLTQAFEKSTSDMDDKQIKKINRRNARTARANAFTVKEVGEELNNLFNGDDGQATNSSGEPVRFQFNLIEMQVENPLERPENARGLSNENGFIGLDNEGNTNIAGAAIVTAANPFEDQPNTSGNYLIFRDDAYGSLAHEVGHTLLTRGQAKEEGKPGYGGLMTKPPGYIKSSEVNKMIEDAYRRKNN